MNLSIIPEASRIPPLTHFEADKTARVELERFLKCVKALSLDVWDNPTDCTLWNVRQILAHQAGAYAGFSSWHEFTRQWSQIFKKPQPGQMSVDLINQRQVTDRANNSPAELIAELEEMGPKGISTRMNLPAILRAMPIPFGPPLGTARLDYLTDLIYTRDTWSHRLDICRAANQDMILTPEHDGRIIALVVRDLALKDCLELKGISYILKLTNPAGGCWRVGSSENPTIALQMDSLDFSRLASGRFSPDEALSQALITIDGDINIVRQILNNISVPY